jgi:hypothetical protein
MCSSLVANDKYNIYTTIAENTGMQTVNQYKRPVLNRTEKDKGAYFRSGIGFLLGRSPSFARVGLFAAIFFPYAQKLTLKKGFPLQSLTQPSIN